MLYDFGDDLGIENLVHKILGVAFVPRLVFFLGLGDEILHLLVETEQAKIKAV